MATIHKRRLVSGKVVWELCHGSGRARQRFVAGRSREEAEETLKQFQRQLALHGQAPSDGSVDAAFGEYSRFLQSNRRPGTVRRYLRVLTTFRRCFLNVHHPDIQRLRQLRPAHLEEFKQRRLEGSLSEATDEDVGRREHELRRELAERSRTSTCRDNGKYGWLGRKQFRPAIKARTINYELQVIGTFLRWGIRRNLLVVNPAANVERLRISKRALPKFLTTDQLKRLFGCCGERERRLFMTILLTGMRKGEIEHLTWSDVNFELGVIFIQDKPEWNWQPKTDERLIPISPVLRELLTVQFRQRANDSLVFPNKAGNRDTHILGKLTSIAKRAGIRTNVHALRHSFGAHLRMAGVSLADIADLLGHKDLATTQIYAKVHQQHLRTAVGKLTPIAEEVTDPTAANPRGIDNREDVPAVRGLLKD